MQADAALTAILCADAADGKSTLTRFDTATAALEAALAMQKDPESRTRIGIHLGDADIADRLRLAAGPGGICISQPLYDVVRSKMVFQAQHAAPKTLKNMEAWHVADVHAELHLPPEAGVKARPFNPKHRFLPFAVIAGMIAGGAVAWWWIAHHYLKA